MTSSSKHTAACFERIPLGALGICGIHHLAWCMPPALVLYSLSLHPVFEGFVASILLRWSLCSVSTMFRTMLCLWCYHWCYTLHYVQDYVLCQWCYHWCYTVHYVQDYVFCYCQWCYHWCHTLHYVQDDVLCPVRMFTILQLMVILMLCFMTDFVAAQVHTLHFLCLLWFCGVHHISGDATLCLHYVWRFCVICSVVLIKWDYTLPLQCFMILQYSPYWDWCHTPVSYTHLTLPTSVYV